MYFASEDLEELSAYGLPQVDIEEVSRDPKLMRKSHQNTYRFNEDQLVERYGYLMPVGSTLRSDFLKLASAKPIVSTCNVCRGKDRPRPRPKIKGSGLRARGVSQILALDTVEMTINGQKRKVLHGIDIFSRFSLAILSGSTGSDTVKFLNLWTFISGRAPKVLVTDFGSEFENASVRAWTRAKFCEFYHTPVYTPQSNGIIERANGTLKIWADKVQQNSNIIAVKDEDILLEALIAKNATTKRFNIDSHTLALGYPAVDAIVLPYLICLIQKEMLIPTRIRDCFFEARTQRKFVLRKFCKM